MRELLPAKLWIGNAYEARDIELMHRLGIHAVLDLAIEEPPATLARDLTYVRCPIDDSQAASLDSLELAIRTAAMLVELEIPSMIACGAGLSRSPAIAAAAIALNQHKSLGVVLLQASQQAATDISPGLLKRVQEVLEHLGTRLR